MTMNYILNVTTLEELKKEYKRLAMQYHPDLGGDTEIMKAINNEYDYLFELLKFTHKNKDGEYYTKENTQDAAAETPEVWKDIINSLIQLHMIDVTVEVIGSFLWISGNTKPYKDQLKALKFKWSTNKSAWYLAPDGYRKSSKLTFNLDDISSYYGSSKINTEDRSDNKSTPIKAISA